MHRLSLNIKMCLVFFIQINSELSLSSSRLICHYLCLTRTRKRCTIVKNCKEFCMLKRLELKSKPSCVTEFSSFVYVTYGNNTWNNRVARIRLYFKIKHEFQLGQTITRFYVSKFKLVKKPVNSPGFECYSEHRNIYFLLVIFPTTTVYLLVNFSLLFSCDSPCRLKSNIIVFVSTCAIFITQKTQHQAVIIMYNNRHQYSPGTHQTVASTV